MADDLCPVRDGISGQMADGIDKSFSVQTVKDIMPVVDLMMDILCSSCCVDALMTFNVMRNLFSIITRD